MITIQFKLYASLQDFLPAGAKDNAVKIAIEEDTTIEAIATQYRLPPELLQLVLVNGVFVPPSARPSYRFRDGDTLAIWPPVAGG